MRRSVLGLVLVLFLLSSLMMEASSIPAATVGGTGGISGLPSTPLEMGFRFTPTVILNVTALGLWDANLGAIPAGSQVGLFGPASGYGSGTLLASVSYPSASTMVDGFSYISLSAPVVLAAGTEYTLLSYYPGSTTVPLDLLGSVTFNSELSNVHFTNSYLYAGSGLTFLGTVPGGASDYSQFGANFEFEAATATPEPASGALLAIGALALGLLVCRRKTVPGMI